MTFQGYCLYLEVVLPLDTVFCWNLCYGFEVSDQTAFKHIDRKHYELLVIKPHLPQVR